MDEVLDEQDAIIKQAAQKKAKGGRFKKRFQDKINKINRKKYEDIK